MHKPAVKHTLSIFQRMHDSLPPLVPRDVVQELREKLATAYEDHHISLEELEDIMIYVGKKIWPYVQAFEEIYQVYEHKLGERLLEQRASPGIKKKFSLFKQMGGTLKDIFAGKVHEIFEYHERVELTELLVDLKYDVRKHATQAILTHEFKKYIDAVETYGGMIEEINETLENLRRFGSEIKYRDMSEDIHDKARTIEYSLVFLGPRISMDEIRGVLEYYEGKVREKTFH